ncbi:MAG: response regulator [Candidatus Omnitrophica bacterium]|nr:response regulator [Candidatus Omnitrophota bacterium]
MEEKKLKVLVVDDEKIIRDFFKRLLTLLHLEVIEAEDGYKAIELAKKEKFDIFFMDVRMPGINGLETYLKLKEDNPDVKVVMMTGYAVEDILTEATKEGAHSIIRKPFDINEIKGVIDNIDKQKENKELYALVIDDDNTILNFFSSLLKNKNIKYKVAGSKAEAMEMANKESFDMIFLDLVLKDSNGIEVYNEIRKVLPKAEIVLMSGYRQKADEARKEIDVAGCLYKPFEIDNVLKEIEKVKSSKK